MMKLIAVTSPDFLDGEVERIVSLLEHEGFWAVHLRKPGASQAQYVHMLDLLPESCIRRVVVHDHFELCRDYPLMGIHLNSRNPTLPLGYVGQRSCSCHTLEEVSLKKPMVDYLFLSPIFDSISKSGYLSVFSQETLQRAAACGVIDRKVVALGGVTADKVEWLHQLGFGGAAMMGALWGTNNKQGK